MAGAAACAAALASLASLGKEVECEGPQIGHKFTFDDVFIEIDESEVIKSAPPRKGQLVFAHRPSVGTWLQRVTVRPTATAATAVPTPGPKRRRMSQAINDKVQLALKAVAECDQPPTSGTATLTSLENVSFLAAGSFAAVEVWEHKITSERFAVKRISRGFAAY